jgi:hypothetical protein
VHVAEHRPLRRSGQAPAAKARGKGQEAEEAPSGGAWSSPTEARGTGRKEARY